MERGRLKFYLLLLVFLGCSKENQWETTKAPKPLEVKSFKYAQNFSVDVYNGFKKVTVKNPWAGSAKNFEYILKPKKSSLDTNFGEIPVIETPVEKIITLSTVYLPLIDSLKGIDKIVGVADAAHVNNPSIRKKLDAGTLPEIKSGGSVNYEEIMELNPEVVFSFAVGNSKYDTHGSLQSRKIPVVLMASYMEETPLGRAEWIKFMALFLEQDSLAEVVFSQTDSAYQQLCSLTEALTSKPTILSGSVFGGVWHVPGGNSFTARLYADAGGDYLWKENEQRGGVPLSFENVYEKASEADYWLNTSSWKSLKEGLGQDKRYALFKALKEKKVYNNNARLNATGGNDFYESGSASPHLVLKDLINIFHPNILPSDSLYFYKALQ